MDSGYITISRSLFKHWIWEEDRQRTQVEAWLDLLQRTNFRDNSRLVHRKLFHEKRGQLVASYRYLGEAWKWSPGRVKRQLDLWEREGMIKVQTEQGITCITICNYDKYNKTPSANGTEAEQQRNSNGTPAKHERNSSETRTEQGRNTDGTNRIKDNKDNKEKKDNNYIEDPPKNEKTKNSSVKILDEQKTLHALRLQFPNIDVETELEKMKDWLRAGGKQKKDYLAFARNWLRNCEAKFKNNRQNGPQNPQGHSAPVEKIGNTPIEEIRAAKEILDASRENDWW